MKKLLLILLVFCSFVCNAQLYRTTNPYSACSSIDNIDSMHVYEGCDTVNFYSEIDDQYVRVIGTHTNKTPFFIIAKNQLEPVDSLIKINAKYVPLFIVFLMVSLILVMRLMRKKEQANKRFFFIAGILILIAITEVVYFGSVKYGLMGGTPFFCAPKIVGWFWTVIFFFITGLLFFVQALSITSLKEYLEEQTNSKISIKWGVYAVIATFIGLIILYVVYTPSSEEANNATFANFLYGAGALFLIQILIFIYKLKKMPLHALVMIIAFFSTILMMFILFLMMIVKIVVAIAIAYCIKMIYAFIFRSTSEGATSASKGADGQYYTNKGDKLEHIKGNVYKDDGGETYRIEK